MVEFVMPCAILFLQLFSLYWSTGRLSALDLKRNSN